MERGCIYCGEASDLSKSDIIPDALTNKKIINPNVCRIEHNSKFSDLFESKIIKELAIIANELDIRSSKTKSGVYPLYDAKIKLEEDEYSCILAEMKTVTSITQSLGKSLLESFMDISKGELLTKNSLKRFAIDYKLQTQAALDLNSQATNTKEICNFYLLYLIGKNDDDFKITDLNNMIRGLYGDILSLNDEFISKIKPCLLLDDSVEAILRGASLVANW